jgi:hypothetical protein
VYTKNPSNFQGTDLATHDRVANSTSPITLRNVRQFDRPLQDEWGLYDPRQAGLEALLRKLQSPSSDTDSTHEAPAPAPEPAKKW